MFIFLSKLLPLFIYPLGLACILLLIAMLVSYKRKTSTTLVIIALIILWLSSTTGFSNLLARSLELKYLPPSEIPTAEVMVVLGGGTEPASPPRTTIELNGAGDRVIYAAQLYKEGKTAHILLSGGDIEWLSTGNTTPAEDMASILIQLGVPEDALWLETESKNTYENALYAREFLDEQEINQILLVTSAMHMPRAVALFEKQGFEVIPLPVDFSVTENLASTSRENNFITKLIDILPSASNLALTTNALKEYLGYFIYKIQGWL
jgi:uncharacterized SAM-binding protein YcdF (DUF218 family)